MKKSSTPSYYRTHRRIERRRLYSELGYQSLFEYAVKELKYSESQTSRRLLAMRLMKEISRIEMTPFPAK